MALKNYTLYFRKNDNKDLPVVSLDLKKMDEYTSNYINYMDLYKSLPEELKDFISEERISDKDLSTLFFITDEDYNPIMDVIFEDDIDVIYITPKELEELIKNEQMSYEEFQLYNLKTRNVNNVKEKYEFFKYLYETYVKNKKIASMIDDYDAKRIFSNMKEDDVMIASIACDKDNLIILCKKLSQELESRRNLALKFKKLFIKNENSKKMLANIYVKERKNKDLDIKDLYDQMHLNLINFKNN